jgi:predicted phosphoribosyltransferase
MQFEDRTDAGRRLAARLLSYANRGDVLVLALPRGGVPVAYEVAERLDAPLDVFLVRKLGVPGREELAMGAIASGGVLVLNHEVIQGLQIPPEVIRAAAERETAELERRERAYREDRPAADPRGKIVILIDDGLATGASMQSAIKGLRKQDPTQIVAAVPVAPRSTTEDLQAMVDDLICVIVPEPFFGVGYWYEDFRQTTDEEVRRLLRQAHQRHNASARSDQRSE